VIEIPRAFTLRVDGRELSGGDVRIREERAADGSTSVWLEVGDVHHVEEVSVELTVADPVEVFEHAWFDDHGLQQSTAVFVRFEERGAFACVANPFGRSRVDGAQIRLWYRPAIDVDGTFVSDPFVFGEYVLEGREVRRDVLPGRDTVRGKESAYVNGLGRGAPVVLDAAEARALRDAVEARVPWEPSRMQISHWDWAENLYRRDPGDAETRAIYDRLTEVCARIGVRTLLFCPSTLHGAYADPAEEAADGSGPYQHAMWLAMGNEVGLGTWEPGNEPAGLDEILESARSRGLDPVAYVNPQYLWLRDERWEVVHEPGEEIVAGYRMTCLADARAREYLLEQLSRFVRQYGLGGITLDFVFWRPCHSTEHGHEPGEDSLYAQWDGYRRVVEALRDDGVEWVEGLMATQETMPWGSDGLTHPHPFMGDNQPQWVSAWPDLSLHRAAGNYQRRVGYWFRNFAFLPTYKIPGQVSHQANRLHYADVERGWDWAGARYNLLSAIASAPSTLSFCFLPCWDEREWAAMLERDGEFFARWIAFAREHEQVLSRLDDLFDEPESGKVDGTAAIGEDGHGFVFLANPNFEPHAVAVPRLPAGRALRELHPEEGRLWLPERVEVEPHEIGVYELVPSDAVEPGALAGDGVQRTLGPWLDANGNAVELGGLVGAARVSASWAPGSALPELLAALAPPLEPEGRELLQPWSDPSRLRIFLEILDPQSVTVRARVEGEHVAVSQAYVGTFEDVKDPERLGLENNLLGHYLDLHDRLLATDDLERPWRIELEVDGLGAGLWRGVHIAELPRPAAGSFTMEPA
jgi:hypothetical protein